jgi:hypothetical protein
MYPKICDVRLYEERNIIGDKAKTHYQDDV